MRSKEELKRKLEELKGKRIVFTNGVFDILTVAHVTYLEKAKELGDYLVVFLNSDKSVKKLKGECRPINKEEDRARVLMALKSVDFVHIFDEERIENLIKEFKPKIYVKGGDYTLETLHKGERELLERYEAEIHLIPKLEGVSTTNIINKINRVIVVNAIIRKGNRFLIVKKREGIHKGKWVFPGGRVKEEEGIVEGLKREVKEETNLDIGEVKRFISDYNYPGEEDRRLGMCFLVGTLNEDVKLNSELEDFKWVTKEEFKEYDYLKYIEDEVEKIFQK